MSSYSSTYLCPSFSWKSSTNLSKSSKEQSKVVEVKEEEAQVGDLNASEVKEKAEYQDAKS